MTARTDHPDALLVLPVGAHLVRDAFAFEKPRQELSPSLRSASHFLLGGQEKVTKEKATPLGACRAMPGKSVSRGRAFRPDSCPDEKASTSMSMPASRPCRPRLTAAQGSEKPLSPQPSPPRSGGEGAKSKSQSFTPRAFRSGAATAYRVRATMARAVPGPLCSGGRAEEKPEGWPAWMPASLSSGQDALSTNPVARTRTLRTGCPQGAEAGWPFSLATFSLATQRESSSRSARRAKALLLASQKASRTGCAPTESRRKSIATEVAPTGGKS